MHHARRPVRPRIVVALVAPVLFLLSAVVPATAAAVPAYSGDAGVKVQCSSQVPPGDWFFAESYPSCGACLQAGAAEEATGNFRAHCLTTSTPSTLLLLNCIVCRDSDGVAPDRVTAPPRGGVLVSVG